MNEVQPVNKSEVYDALCDLVWWSELVIETFHVPTAEMEHNHPLRRARAVIAKVRESEK